MEPTQKPAGDMTGTELAARHAEIVESVKDIAAKPDSELTANERAQKAAAAAEITEIKTAFETLTAEPAAELDLTELAADAVIVDETVEVVAEVSADTGETVADDAANLELVAAAAHTAAVAPDGGAKVERATARVMRASTNDAVRSISDLATDYADAVRSTGTKTVWQASRRHAGMDVATSDQSQAEHARIMGLTGGFDLNQASACDPCSNPEFLNDVPNCFTSDDLLQEWIPKFQMTNTCEVKVRNPQATKAPELFEWHYGECDAEGNVIGAGLIVDGVPTTYDPEDEATWKPVSDTDINCSDKTYKLRSVGYVRKVGRGLDLCNPGETARALENDTAYLAKSKALAIIGAFNTYADDNGHAHTFDATGYATPAAALADMMAELLPCKAREYGVSAAGATLIAPSDIAKKLGVARFESIADNTTATLDGIASACGVGGTAVTDCLIDAAKCPVPAAIPAGVRVLPDFDIYLAWRDAWRQGQGPGVRGTVSDEKHLRTNCRMYLVEDDLVNIPVGCLSTIRITVSGLCTVGSHANGIDVACA